MKAIVILVLAVAVSGLVGSFLFPEGKFKNPMKD